MSQPAEYLRRLTLFDATMLVIGGIIGSGIFLNPRVVAERVGTPFLTIGVWVLGGLVALAGAFCFAELGARKPQAGGGYVYLRDAFGPLPGFLYGWTQLLVINSGGIAAVSMTFAYYTNSLVGNPDADTRPLAIGAIVALSAVNYFGIKPGSVVQNTFTVLKLAALAALIVLGLTLADSTAPPPAAPTPAAPTGVGATVTAIGAALIPVLFAYGGWQSTNFVAAEMRDAKRDLPRALIIGVIAVVAVYVLANIVYVNVLGVTGLASSTAPASEVMRSALGAPGATLIGIGIAVSTFGFLNLAVLSAPRMYQTMAADGVFFGGVAGLHREFRVPAAALFLQAGWAIVLVLSKEYGQLLDFVVFGDWIFFGLTAATLFFYRSRADNGEGFRMRWYPAIPVFFVVVAIFAVVSTVLWNPADAGIGALLIAGGVPFFLFWKWLARRREGR